MSVKEHKNMFKKKKDFFTWKTPTLESFITKQMILFLINIIIIYSALVLFKMIPSNAGNFTIALLISTLVLMTIIYKRFVIYQEKTNNFFDDYLTNILHKSTSKKYELSRSQDLTIKTYFVLVQVLNMFDYLTTKVGLFLSAEEQNLVMNLVVASPYFLIIKLIVISLIGFNLYKNAQKNETEYIGSVFLFTAILFILSLVINNNIDVVMSLLLIS